VLALARRLKSPSLALLEQPRRAATAAAKVAGTPPSLLP
jgi:hypothetical protein